MISQELKKGKDDLAKWVSERPHHFIESDDPDTQDIYQQVINKVMVGSYDSGNRDNFLANADPWLIAKAKSIDATIVTQESLAVSNTKRIKIPNICQQFDVPCLNTFKFLRKLNAKFVLGV